MYRRRIRPVFQKIRIPRQGRFQHRRHDPASATGRDPETESVLADAGFRHRRKRRPKPDCEMGADQRTPFRNEGDVGRRPGEELPTDDERGQRRRTRADLRSIHRTGQNPGAERIPDRAGDGNAPGLPALGTETGVLLLIPVAGRLQRKRLRRIHPRRRSDRNQDRRRVGHVQFR